MAKHDHSIEIPAHISLVASLVVDKVGRVSDAGSSLPLSSAEDRTRLRTLRNWASAIIVGSKTYQSGGYQRSPIPVIVYSRGKEEIGDWSHEMNRIRATHGPNILIEAGPNILEQLLRDRLIDRLYLTRTSRKSQDAASPYFDLSLLGVGSDLELVDTMMGLEDVFEIYERRGIRNDP